ncbi:hypothetical protein [Streptomyces sioyaensis]|uniref:hypothetical protein n=1 Tax=Streptomyces sioyaensis TaxID=67364 RepID=UPI003716D792
MVRTAWIWAELVALLAQVVEACRSANQLEVPKLDQEQRAYEGGISTIKGSFRNQLGCLVVLAV